jgi:SAM-dependent methyltransferase
VNGQLVLVDFADSILIKTDFVDRSGAAPLSTASSPLRDFVIYWYRKIAHPVNKAAHRLTVDMAGRLRLACSAAGKPRMLVIGGGLVGSGVDHLYEARDIDLIGTDIFVSPSTRLVADGHKLPFADETFDAVLVQAVLEHVLNPQIVVEEIYRVLRPGGLVYADTPFMQQVHEKAYDFTRFTVSGHRWLFRKFELIEAGASLGAGTALLWSIRYFIAACTGNWRLGQIAALPLLWLHYFDGRSRNQQDAASGVYFYGIKSGESVQPRDMIKFYEAQLAANRSGAAKRVS